MLTQFQPPAMCSRQPADQAAQSHIQPGLECLQGWGIHSLLGQPVQCVTTLRQSWAMAHGGDTAPLVEGFPALTS